MTGTGECCRQYLTRQFGDRMKGTRAGRGVRGEDFDMEPGRRPPMAPSRPRVPTIRESGEYISICCVSRRG